MNGGLVLGREEILTPFDKRLGLFDQGRQILGCGFDRRHQLLCRRRQCGQLVIGEIRLRELDRAAGEEIELDHLLTGDKAGGLEPCAQALVGQALHSFGAQRGGGWGVFCNHPRSDFDDDRDSKTAVTGVVADPDVHDLADWNPAEQDLRALRKAVDGSLKKDDEFTRRLKQGEAAKDQRCRDCQADRGEDEAADEFRVGATAHAKAPDQLGCFPRQRARLV